MKYIVALGNPGDKYRQTRHNVGFMALDFFIDQYRLPSLMSSKADSGQVTRGCLGDEEVKILYPDTYMNNSGSAVVKLVNKQTVGDLIVVHDDIDLPFGEIKVSKNQGSGGNNGIKSIIDKLDSKDFVRVKIGIAPKSLLSKRVVRPKGGGPLERFVLKPFGVLESRQLPDVLSRASEAIFTIVDEGVEAAMNKFN